MPQINTLEQTIATRFQLLKPTLDERNRRLWAAAEAKTIGYGGIAIVHRATGIAHKTIMAGLRELGMVLPKRANGKVRIRRSGGGRKPVDRTDPTLESDIESLVEPTARGHPESRLRWTTKSLRNLAEALQVMGHTVSHSLVGSVLHRMQYSLQANRKTSEGKDHPDRDAQFQFINTSVTDFITRNQPAISVDTKKKENVGNYANKGAEWLPKGKPREVNMHDFPDKDLGKVAPYGIYDIDRNEGWVNVGIDHDTAEFATASIKSWWDNLGKQCYTQATELLITADCGGSNNARSRLWKVCLQQLANDTGLTVHVRHFPPGTSKWNKIEHKLFSFITKNWQGTPLIDRATVVNLIAGTRTKTGLQVYAQLDENEYPTGKKVSDEELARVNLGKEDFHGEWNYYVRPTVG